MIDSMKEKVRIRKVSPESGEIHEARALYHRAFPPEERIEDAHLLELMKEGRALLLAIDEGGEEPDPACAGYAYLITEGGVGYLLFFAVDEERRGRGYGGAFLQWLAASDLCDGIVLDVEDPEVDAHNRQERIERERFYLERGFFRTPYRLTYEGERFVVLCTSRELDLDGFRRLVDELRKLGSVIDIGGK